MATVGRSFSTDDLILTDDDGPIAVRDSPQWLVRVPRRVPRRMPRSLTGNSWRPVEIKERERKLSANFDKLSFREQFLERCRLYDWHLKHYQDTQRPDLKAMKQMKKSAFKFTGLGPVPGVEVGDTFDYRGEMYVVGLHRTDQAGIACVNHGGDTVACSVVVSGGYEDDVDRGDIIEYTGHGGNDYKGGKQQTKDQELKAGNLALLNSCRLRTPVRVIRGPQTQKNFTGNPRTRWGGTLLTKNIHMMDCTPSIVTNSQQELKVIKYTNLSWYDKLINLRWTWIGRFLLMVNVAIVIEF